jgi:hypothetical protein
MATNPYASPGKRDADSNIDPLTAVRGPATALIVVSIICLVVVSLALLFSGFLLLSGTASRMQQPSIGISKETQIVIRMLWSGIILAANVVILIGAIRMQRLQSYSWAKVAATLAVIPCIGPCYLLGIPFGIWALVALSKPGVRQAFR